MNQEKECIHCGLLKATIDSTNVPCQSNKSGTYHEFDKPTAMEKSAQKRTEILLGIDQQIRERKPTTPADWEAAFDRKFPDLFPPLLSNSASIAITSALKRFIRKLINDTKEKT